MPPEQSPSPSSEPKRSDSARKENAFQGYWRVYGGVWSVLRSTYFWVAVVLTIVFPDVWRNKDAFQTPVWAGITLGIFPSVLGFALGGMAIMLSFSTGKFLDSIRQRGRDDSYLRKMMASFFHFTLILTAALLVAFLTKFYSNEYFSAFGVFLSFYGILLITATASRIWHTARIFNMVRGDGD